MTNFANVTDREDLFNIIWDLGKDATGIRPRWIDFEGSTIAELQRTATMYANWADEQIAHEHQMEDEAIAEYEARVADLVKCGAGDRVTAVRWMIEGEEYRYFQDVEELMYTWGMPYTFTNRLPEHIKAEVKEAFAQADVRDGIDVLEEA